jgi:hypothetical protein
MTNTESRGVSSLLFLRFESKRWLNHGALKGAHQAVKCVLGYCRGCRLSKARYAVGKYRQQEDIRMSLTDFRNGIEQHAHQMQACINTAGLHIRHEPNFSYTVGFSALGLPELVVERLPLTHAEELLRTLWNSARLANTKNRDWARLGHYDRQ